MHRKHYRIYDTSSHGTLIITLAGEEIRVPKWQTIAESGQS